jgi:hypothetical protein
MPVDPQHNVEVVPPPAIAGWTAKLAALLFILFSFEIGVFLLVFPWLEPWQNNWMAEVAPWLRGVWENPFFRGALSGLGFVNICIALLEAFRLRRFFS